MSLFLHRLASRDLERAISFYRDALGLRLVGRFAMGEQHRVLFRFPGAGRHDATLELSQFPEAVERDTPFDGGEPSSGYWKIGITLPNLEEHHERLAGKGLEIEEPKPFENVGTLCHLRDPDGHRIELLERAPLPDSTDGGSSPQGGGLPPDSTFAHVSLRATEIERTRHFYQQTLGMNRLACLPIDRHGFQLDFYAFTDETLPGSHRDHPSEEQIAWLWQRPYTVLEVQHFDLPAPAPDAETFHGSRAAHGFLGVTFQVDGQTLEAARERTGRAEGRGALELRDPDGAPITLRTAGG